MKKYLWFIIFLLLPFRLYAAGVFGVENPAKVFSVTTPNKVFGVDGLVGCTEFYAPSFTADDSMPIGDTASIIGGTLYTTGAGAENTCEIKAHVYSIVGTLTASHDYYLRIYSVNGSGFPTGILGTSSKVDGDSLSDGGYNAIFAITLASPLSATTQYGIGIFLDSDGDPNDDPEGDGSNYWRWGMDNENSGDDTLTGRRRWDYEASYPYSGYVTDVEDDVLIKVSTK